MKRAMIFLSLFNALTSFAEDLTYVADRALRNSYKENHFIGEEKSPIAEDALGVWSFRMVIPRWALDPVYSAFLKPDSDRIFVYVISSDLNELERYQAAEHQHIEFRVVMTENLYKYASKESCTRWIDQNWEARSRLFPSVKFEFVAGARLAQVWLEEEMPMSRCLKLKEMLNAE